MEEVYFEHVDVQYIPEKSSSGKVVRLLQASDVDSEHIWYQIVGKTFLLKISLRSLGVTQIMEMR